LTTSRTKRWNGTLESLSPDYLKGVAERMESYGDRVQFELPGHAKQPIYQVINPSDRRMGFDGRHLLLRLNESGNVADSLSPIFTLDAVRAAIAGRRTARSPAATRSGGPGRGSAAARRAAAPAVATDTVEKEKYAYYREHRDALPEDIARYASEISALMRTGKSAEEAFHQVIAEYY
jgi:hypothetical protein